MALTETEKAYLAGFIDGEGCIDTTKAGSSNISKRIRLTITNTNEVILRYIKDLIGFGSFYSLRPARYQNQNTKECFVYQVCSLQAVQVLKEVLLYLKVKKGQAILAIEYARTMKRGRKKIPSKIINKREKINNKLKALNKRGV